MFKSTNNTLTSVFSILLVTLVFVSCEKETYQTASSVEEWRIQHPLSWLVPLEDGQIKRNELFVFSERSIGSQADPAFRINGNFWNSATNQPINVTSIQIGEIEFPVREGRNNAFFSKHSNVDDWKLLNSYINESVEVVIKASDTIVDSYSMSIAAPLELTIDQEGTSPYSNGFIDKTKPLTFKWKVPDNRITLRGEQTRELVGSQIVYQPQVSAQMSGRNSLPTETITISHSEVFDVGQLTFTVADLQLLPSNGMVTLYIGSVRYRVNADGSISYNGGSTGGGSGGGGSGPIIRVNEP